MTRNSAVCVLKYSVGFIVCSKKSFNNLVNSVCNKYEDHLGSKDFSMQINQSPNCLSASTYFEAERKMVIRRLHIRHII